MNIRQLAELDLAYTLEDTLTGFGWPVTMTDPDGFTGNGAQLYGQSNDISQIIDADTGTAVSGKQSAAVLRLSSVTAAGFSEPKGIADSKRRPWLVTFDDVNGAGYTFKVEYADPDRTLGTVTLVLGAWK